MATAHALRIRLFGEFEIVRNGAPLSLPRSPKTRSLVGFLIVHAGRAFPRHRLAGTFWPDRPDARARRALSQALWQINRALDLPAGRLSADRETVAWIPAADDWSDVTTFERQIDYALDTPHASLDPAYLSDLDRALALYRADLLLECYDDWVLAERERLRERYLQALERAVAVHKQRSNDRQALAYARQLVAADPLREQAHREVMRLYHLLGRPQAALEQFVQLRDRLGQELGLAPTLDTVALYQEIAAGLGEHNAPYLPVEPPPPPLLHDLARLPLVGRSEQRAELLDAVHAAGQGHGRVVWIEGDAGVGKTRLVEQIVADARWRGVQTGVAKADPRATLASYQLLCDALAPLLTPLRLTQLGELVEPRWLGALLALFPAIATHLPDLPTRPPADAQQERQRLHQGLFHCLAGLSAIAPLMLVFEDVHWADQATLEALHALTPHLAAQRTLVVLSGRSAEARQRSAVWQALDDIDRRLPLLRIQLAVFDQREVTTLIRRALRVADADAEATAFARRLGAEVGCNALFLVETLKSLLAQGALVPTRSGWRFPDAGRALPIPSSTQDLIGERLQSLDPASGAILAQVSILGQDANFAALRQIGDLEAGDLAETMQALCRLGFLVESKTGYRFEHDLVQEIVYRDIPPGRRQALHARAGAMLEARHPEQIERLAFHFERGGVRDKARAYALQAGDRARQVHDYEQALAHYRHALDLCDDDASLCWEALARQERALNALSCRQEQGEVLDQMLCLAQEMADPILAARTYHRRGWWEVLAGDPVQALALLDRGGALAEAAGERDLLGACRASAARAWWRIGDVGRCRQAAEEARDLFAGTGDRKNQVQALSILGNLHLGLTGNYALALDYFEQVVRISRERGDRYAAAGGGGNAGITYAALGCYRRSLHALDEAWQIMSQVGDRLWMGILRHWQGFNHRALGDLDRAQRLVEEALGICRDVGNRNFEIESLGLLGEIALDRRDLDQARRRFERAAAVADENQQTMDWIQQLSWLALTRLFLGHRQKARRLSAQAIEALEAFDKEMGRAYGVYFRHYQVVAHTADAEAAAPYLERAFSLLMAAADSISDAALHRSFLENVAQHRAIVRAHRFEEAPALAHMQTVRLPRAAAPTGRPLRPEEWVTVRWTLSMLEDDQIEGRVARRQHQLLRILHEAAAQSAAPTVRHLADALRVSTRTIERDLAALRARGHTTPTRGHTSPPA